MRLVALCALFVFTTMVGLGNAQAVRCADLFRSDGETALIRNLPPEELAGHFDRIRAQAMNAIAEARVADRMSPFASELDQVVLAHGIGNGRNYAVIIANGTFRALDIGSTSVVDRLTEAKRRWVTPDRVKEDRYLLEDGRLLRVLHKKGRGMWGLEASNEIKAVDFNFRTLMTQIDFAIESASDLKRPALVANRQLLYSKILRGDLALRDLGSENLLIGRSMQTDRGYLVIRSSGPFTYQYSRENPNRIDATYSDVLFPVLSASTFGKPFAPTRSYFRYNVLRLENGKDYIIDNLGMLETGHKQSLLQKFREYLKSR